MYVHGERTISKNEKVYHETKTTRVHYRTEIRCKCTMGQKEERHHLILPTKSQFVSFHLLNIKLQKILTNYRSQSR